MKKKTVRKAKPKSVPKFARCNVKLPPDVERVMVAKAKKYAGGNLSAWLRHAGQKYVPKAGEVIERTELRPKRK